MPVAEGLRRFWRARVGAGLCAVALGGALTAALAHDPGKGAMAAGALGGFVGAVELMARYRHAPTRVVVSGGALAYVAVNALAALVAFHAIASLEPFKSMAGEFQRAFAAGLGAMVLLRASVFRVRIGESDIGIGPAALLDSMLMIADRSVDRREGVARATDVSEILSRVRDPKVAARMLAKYSLALMQNVDTKTAKDLELAVNEILAQGDTPEEIKIDIIALKLGVIVGPDVMAAAIDAINGRLAVGPLRPPGPPAAPPPATGSGEPAAPSKGLSASDLQAEIERDA